MSVESATYISQLNSALPAAGDPRSEGDDHVRLVKAVLKATFPNVSGAVTLTQSQINSALQASTSGQWSLMLSTTVSGSPSVIEFKNGTGGVEISSNYDQYLIDFTNIKSSTGTATLRMQVSENAGSSYPANATGCSWESDYISGSSSISRGTGSAFLTLANVGVPSTDGLSLSGRILIARPLSGVLNNPVRAEISGGEGSAALMVTTAGSVGSTTNQFDAVRLALSAGTFAGSNARVRFYARKA